MDYRFRIEVIELLKNEYLDTVTFGFKRDDKWIEPTLQYTAKDLARFNFEGDDPGRIKQGETLVELFFLATSLILLNGIGSHLNKEMNLKKAFHSKEKMQMNLK